MIVVVDTNVFVSAILGPGGASRAVIRACLEGQIHPLMGEGLYLEYEELLERDDLYERTTLTPTEREALLNAFLSACRWTRVYFLWRPNLRDEDDNQIVELAVAGGASIIITQNIRDFRGAELRFPGLRVLRPDELIQEIHSWRP